MANNYQRRKFFIKKDFQGKLLLICFLFAVGAVLLSNAMLAQGLLVNGILIVIGFALVTLASLLLSHRVTGPLYRFEATLDNMQKGRLDITIHLRDKDQGKELAQKINEFNLQLSRSFRSISHSSKAMENLIEQANTLNLPEQEKEQLACLCWTMREHNRKIFNNCSYYTPTKGNTKEWEL